MTVRTGRQDAASPKSAARRGADDDVDLLADMNDTSSASTKDNESFDLLSDMTEDGGTPWYPWDADDQPEGIQGTVKYIGTVEREAKFGGGDAPYVEIQDKDGTVWAVRGYATVLANQLNRAIDTGLKNGDLIAVKYMGEKQNRKGDNTYKNFLVRSVSR